jgi:hypothetical protein
VNDFKFGEGPDGPTRSDAKFKEGEAVYTLFEVRGCKPGPDKKVTISEVLTVTGPDGKEVLNVPDMKLEVADAGDSITANNKIMLEGQPSGKYEVKMVLTDKNGGATTTHNSSFQWEGSGEAATSGGGDQPAQSGGGDVKVANFTFAEGDNRESARDSKQFQAGEVVFLVFDIQDFKQDKDGTVWVQEDLKVTDPEGNVILDNKNLLDLKDKGEPGTDNVSAHNKITLEPGNPPGTYRVSMIVRDKIGGQETTFEEEFEVQAGE